MSPCKVSCLIESGDGVEDIMIREYRADIEKAAVPRRGNLTGSK